MNYECITTRIEGEKVAIITLNRPKQLNALNDQLMDELGHALKGFDADSSIGCMVITGSEKAFAAGADITAMAKLTFSEVYRNDFITRNWEAMKSVRKPVIAAVSGFALGGGCELAMMCDFIIASDTAKFGQPEIKIGIRFGHTFGDEVVTPGLNCGDEVFFGVGGGQENDRGPGPALGSLHRPDAAGSLKAIHHRHLDVHQHQVGCHRTEHLNRLLPILGQHHFMSEIGKAAAHYQDRRSGIFNV